MFHFSRASFNTLQRKKWSKAGFGPSKEKNQYLSASQKVLGSNPHSGLQSPLKSETHQLPKTTQCLSTPFQTGSDLEVNVQCYVISWRYIQPRCTVIELSAMKHTHQSQTQNKRTTYHTWDWSTSGHLLSLSLSITFQQLPR